MEWYLRMTAGMPEQTTLIEKAKEGDAAAFEALVKLNKNSIFNFALSFTRGNHASACDIMQEALIKAYLNIGSFNGKSSFSSWLWKIVRNEFVNHSTSLKSMQYQSLEGKAEEMGGVSESHENTILRDERDANLMNLISMLPLQYKEMIILIELQDLSYEEAAEIAEIKVDAARTRLCRAKKMLTDLAIEHRELFI